MLSEYVSGISLAIDFPQIYSLAPHSLLHPERVSVEVPQFSKTLSGADTYGRRRVRPDSDRCLDPQVSQEALVAQADARSSHDAVELCLAAA